MKKLIGSKNSLYTGITFLFAFLSITTSCSKTMNDMGNTTGTGGTGGKGGSGSPGTNEIWIQGMVFSPSVITVVAGTQITWTNKDAISHTVTSDAGLFDSGSIRPGGLYTSGGTYSYTFATAGTYLYHCAFHPMMTGTIVVN